MDSSHASHTLFAYGTLVFPEVWRRVTGDTEARRSEPAFLEGYDLLRVRDADFPGIVARKGAPRIPGVVYFDLDDETLTRLDAYEDSFYERVKVNVTAERKGERIVCQAYVIPPFLRKRVLTDEPWSLEKFEEQHLQEFSRQLRDGFPGNG